MHLPWVGGGGILLCGFLSCVFLVVNLSTREFKGLHVNYSKIPMCNLSNMVFFFFFLCVLAFSETISYFAGSASKIIEQGGD